jgi:hypothetical protein
MGRLDDLLLPAGDGENCLYLTSTVSRRVQLGGHAGGMNDAIQAQAE